MADFLPPTDRHKGGVMSNRGGTTMCLAVEDAEPDAHGTRVQRRAWDRLHPNVRERVVPPCLGAFTAAHRERRCNCQP